MRKRKLDPIEQEYERAINATYDSDEAYELSVGLKQYRDWYKVDHDDGSD